MMYEDYNSNNSNSYSNGSYTNNNTTGTTPPPVQEKYASYQMNMGHIPEEPKKTPKKKGGFFKKAVACVSLGLLFGVFAGTGLYAVNLITGAADGITKQETSTEVSDIEQTMPAVQEDNTAAKDETADLGEATPAVATKTTVTDASGVADAVMPSVVSITNMYTQTYSFWGQQGESQGEASGSGIIVGENDSELLIATNNHVVDGADQLSVQFIDGKTVDAQLKGAQSNVDLAVIAVPLEDIEQDTKDAIKVATLGDSAHLKVGEPAIAIGNSLGYGQSVTTGVISALNREVTVDNVTNELIQTDAAINPGNSGGALLNINGEVIGINAVKYSASGVEGMGYAIPISTAQPIIDELMNRETRTKVDAAEGAYLGISGIDVTQEVSKKYGMPLGVYIAQVYEGTAAENSGLVKGDIITEFDGQSVTSMEELKEMMEYYAAGTVVDVKIQQGSPDGYTEKTVTIMLGKKTS